MASHAGIIPSATMQGRESSFFLSADKTWVSPGAWPASTPVIAAPSTCSPISISKNIGGILPHSFAEEQIYDRIWFRPVEIDADLIVEAIDYDIDVWNAWHEVENPISAITITNSDGIVVAHEDVPINLAPEMEITHILTILKDGPAVQSSTITYTVGGDDYICSVDGYRIIAMYIDADWGEISKFEYGFNTIISATRKRIEQRRPLIPAPLRKISYSMLVDNLSAQKTINKIIMIHDKIFAVPVTTEAVKSASLTVGNTSILMSNDTANFYNLRNMCDLIIIMDWVTENFEVKKILSITGDTITLNSGIVETFDPETSVIYPVFLGVIETNKWELLTRHAQQIDLSFIELQGN